MRSKDKRFYFKIAMALAAGGVIFHLLGSLILRALGIAYDYEIYIIRMFQVFEGVACLFSVRSLPETSGWIMLFVSLILLIVPELLLS